MAKPLELPKVPVFELDTAGTKFKNKSKDVFGILQTLEEKHCAVESARKKSSGNKDEESLWKNDPLDDVESNINKRNYFKRSLKSDSCDSGQSDFKKPKFQPPARLNKKFKQRFVPDFKKHPEKYTCYSLDDVSASDMSNAANSQAAFAFLEERRKLREQEEHGSDGEEMKVDVIDTACSRGMFTFKSKKQKVETDTEAKSEKSRDSTLVDLPDDDLESMESTESTASQKTDEAASFKRRKNKQRSLRTRDSEDGDD